jgi:hypothetical protein
MEGADQSAAQYVTNIMKQPATKEMFVILQGMAEGHQPDSAGRLRLKDAVARLSDALENLHNSLDKNTDFFGGDAQSKPSEPSGMSHQPQGPQRTPTQRMG